jgi:hypothetical protein
MLELLQRVKRTRIERIGTMFGEGVLALFTLPENIAMIVAYIIGSVVISRRAARKGR